MLYHERGVALDSGCFTRRDRHNAPRPDPQTLAEVKIHADPNFVSKGDKKAKKIWDDYKKKHNLTDQKQGFK